MNTEEKRLRQQISKSKMYLIDVVAKRKAGNIEGWEPWLYQAVEGGLIIKGGVPTLVTKGRTKGQRRWNTKESQTVVVSNDDLTQEQARYEAETPMPETASIKAAEG